MAKEQQSLQDRIRARQQTEFIGRRDYVELYQKNLGLSLDDARRRFLFNIHGDAGVGKTYLTKHIQQLAIRTGALTAYVDETAEDITSVMAFISDGFRHSGTRLGEFDKRLEEYRERRHELESDPQTPAGIATLITKTAVTIGLAAARDIPLAGSLLAPLDVAATADQVDAARAYLARKFADHTDVRLLLSPAEELTPPFVIGLNRAANGRNIALFFDTYERTRPYLDQWLRDFYAGRYGALPETLITTVSGQSPLDVNLWADYLAVTEDILLRSFTEIDARKFLASKGIADEAAILLILSLSEGLPLWMATLASAYLRDGKDIGDPSGSAVERFLKWISDPARREVAITAAMPRLINREVLAIITDRDESMRTFDWLRTVPFVSQRIRSWAYHDEVRTAMLRLRRIEAPARWRSDHSILAAANANWAKEAARGGPSDWTSQAWVEYVREQCYHLLCADPVGNISAVLSLAVDATEHGAPHAYQWVRLISDAGRDTESGELRELGKELEAGIKGDDLTGYISYMIANGKLSKAALASAFIQRGRLYEASSRIDEALADFDNALLISRDNFAVLIWRSMACNFAGRYDEALSDLDRAMGKNVGNVHIHLLRSYVFLDAQRWNEAAQELTSVLELGEVSADTFGRRGQAYYGMGRYQDAIQDCTAALAIDPHNVRALRYRSDAYRATGKHRNSIDDLCKLIEVGPESLAAFVRRGDMYKTIGSYDDSIVDYTSALVIDPSCVHALVQRADSNYRIGSYDVAASDLTHVIELEPEKSSHFVGRAYMYECCGRYDEAITDYVSAIELETDTGTHLALVLAARGALYAKTDCYEEAMVDLERAAELDPSNEVVISARNDARKSMLSGSPDNEKGHNALADPDGLGRIDAVASEEPTTPHVGRHFTGFAADAFRWGSEMPHGIVVGLADA